MKAVFRCLAISLLFAAGCAKKAEPTVEHAEAMAAYDAAMDVALANYAHEAFDEVLQKLRAVPESNPDERRTAEGLIVQIEKARSDIAASDRALKRSLEAPNAPVEQRFEPLNPSAPPKARHRFGQLPPPEPLDAPKTARPPPVDEFSVAANAARQRRLQAEAQKKATQERQAAAESRRARIDAKVKEKVESQPWDCNMITGKCQKEVRVTEEEIREK